jgi:hypothetical protein
MHLLIPFASALSPAAVHTVGTLELPRLSRLLSLLGPGPRTGTDEYSLTPPHERALADAWGWRGADGALPWAATQAMADGLDAAQGAWGLLTPAHWHVGREHITLADPRSLNLDDAESMQLLDAVRPLFSDDGWSVHWGAADRWYASHPSFAGLACASPERVIGRNVDLWLPNTPQVRAIRRLQSEVQMLLYAHPLHDEREARGELPVNSFWLSGCGVHQAPANAAAVQMDDSLRGSLLSADWAAWADAWRALDAGAIAALLARCERGEPVSLTLCGERFAQRYEFAPASMWQRLSRRWRHVAVGPVLEAL